MEMMAHSGSAVLGNSRPGGTPGNRPNSREVAVVNPGIRMVAPLTEMCCPPRWRFRSRSMKDWSSWAATCRSIFWRRRLRSGPLLRQRRRPSRRGLASWAISFHCFGNLASNAAPTRQAAPNTRDLSKNGVCEIAAGQLHTSPEGQGQK